LTFVLHFFALVQAVQGFGVTTTAGKGWQTNFSLRKLRARMQLYGAFEAGGGQTTKSAASED
jgi:hypothetical protein